MPGPLQPGCAKEIIKLFQAKLTKKTKVISGSHVTYTTGLRLPIAELAALARENGSLLVFDGAQAPGGLVVDVKQLGCHAYASSAHKWLLAPMGTGLLYISEEAKDRIQPLLLTGGHRVYTGHSGTRNLPAMIGLGASLEFLNKIGTQTVEDRCAKLRKKLDETLSELPKLQIVSPPSGPFSSPLLTVSLPAEHNTSALSDVLKQKHKIITRIISSHGLNALRLSTHIYNSEEDIEKLTAALRSQM